MIPQAPEAGDIPEASAEDHLETMLDRALEDTFPASDPIGIMVN